MAFVVEVRCRARRTLRLLLSDLVGEGAVRSNGDTEVLSVVDQSALVALVVQLHDLGVVIERVERVERVDGVEPVR